MDNTTTKRYTSEQVTQYARDMLAGMDPDTILAQVLQRAIASDEPELTGGYSGREWMRFNELKRSMIDDCQRRLEESGYPFGSLKSRVEDLIADLKGLRTKSSREIGDLKEENLCFREALRQINELSK